MTSKSPLLRNSTGLQRRTARLLALIAPFAFGWPAPASAQAASEAAAQVPRDGVPSQTIDDKAEMSRFLDRLMASESGGRDHARNPRSTALGPFQFIESTFLEVAKRHFAEETANLSNVAVLALRTNRAFARRAAEAYSRDNAAHLAASGVTPTFANLRLAFLVGPAGAVDVLTSPDAAPVSVVLGSKVVRANPFMAGMTTKELASWSERSLLAPELGSARAGLPAGATAERRSAPKPQLNVRCERSLASCRKWISLALKRQGSRQAAISGRGAKRR